MLLLVASALAGPQSLRATVAFGPDGVELRDAHLVAGRVPARPGALEVKDAAGVVLDSVDIADPRVRSVIYPEGGGDAVRLDHGVAWVDVPWPVGAEVLSWNAQQLHPAPPPPPTARATRILGSGDAAERLDLVILADGYTAEELDLFAADARDVVDYLLSIAPYERYRRVFNVWRVDSASAESGIGQDGEGRGSAYDCFYDCADIDRLVCCDDATVLDTVSTIVPDADGVLVLVNDTEYGGSGGFNYATAYARGGPISHQMAAHELGHSLIGLMDEYSYGYEGDLTGPNCDIDPVNPTWRSWLGTDGVGAFPTCGNTNLFRPTDHDCLMNTLQDDYCPVCRQQAVLAMYEHLPHIIASTDPEVGSTVKVFEGDAPVVFDVQTVGPSGLQFEWTVDGEPVSGVQAFELNRCSDLNGELRLTVIDGTSWVRDDPDRLLVDRAGPWTIRSSDLNDCGEDGFFAACGCQSGPLPTLSALLLLLPLLRRRS